MFSFLARITRLGFYGALVLSALVVATEVFLIHVPGGVGSRALIKLFGAGSILALSLALGRWLTRQLARRTRSVQLDDRHLRRDLFRYFREHHVLFGVAAIVAATVHGLYFLVVDPRFDNRALTGWAAWLTLVVLVSIGLVLDRRIEVRVGRRKVYFTHVALAVVFLAMATIHANALFIALALWAGIAVAAVGLWYVRGMERQ